jgi:hypothetical protein
VPAGREGMVSGVKKSNFTHGQVSFLSINNILIVKFKVEQNEICLLPIYFRQSNWEVIFADV